MWHGFCLVLFIESFGNFGKFSLPLRLERHERNNAMKKVLRKHPKKTSRSPYINLLQDLMFKTYFSKSPEVLLFLLKAFLPLPKGKSIKSVKILNAKEGEKELTILDSFIYPSSLESKMIVLDLRVQLSTGELVNVEMQSANQKRFLERIIYYWSRLYTETLPRGDDYGKLYPAYSLVFANFNVFPKTKNIVTAFSIRADESPHFALSHHLKIIVVELSGFCKGRPEDLFDLRDLWCYILKESGHMGYKEGEILSQKGREMKMAMTHLKSLSNDDMVRFREEAWEKFQRDLRGQRAYAVEEGHKEGRREGRKEGLRQGMQKGAKQEKTQIALKMLEEGYAIPFIEKITGFSKKKIKDIQKNNLPL